MSFTSWLQNLRSALARRRGQRHHGRRGSLRAATQRPQLETLEDRCLLSFSPAASYAVGLGPQAVVTADFNNDNVQDLAVVNSGSNTVSVLLGNTNGTFQPALTSATGGAPLSLAVGDFNADGTLDLATANAEGTVSVLLGSEDASGNGTGTFGTPTNIDLGSSPSKQSLAVGDFNGDGLLDLGVTSNVYNPGFYSPGFWGGITAITTTPVPGIRAPTKAALTCCWATPTRWARPTELSLPPSSPRSAPATTPRRQLATSTATASRTS